MNQSLVRATDYNGNGVFYAGDKTYSFGGVQGDIPVVGDWNGTGFAKIGIFRSGFWVLDFNGNGSFDAADQAFGYGGDVPVVCDWNGDGKAKVGVVRPFVPGGVLDPGCEQRLTTITGWARAT